MDLYPKQARFVLEYVKGRSGTEAAIKAGYPAQSAQVRASQLLSKLKIRNAIRDQRDAISTRACLSVDAAIREIMLIAFSDLGEVLDFSGDEIREMPARKIDKKKRRSIQSVKIKTVTRQYEDYQETTREVEYKLWDKLAALDKLCRHLAIYADQVELDKLRATLEEIKARQKREEPTNGKLAH